jgi:hypothetical protein
MNNYLCLLICFFVGMLFYHLIKSSCGCNVEGNKYVSDEGPVNLLKKYLNMCLPAPTALCDNKSIESKAVKEANKNNEVIDMGVGSGETFGFSYAENSCPTGYLNIKPTCSKWWTSHSPPSKCEPTGSPCSRGGQPVNCCNGCNTSGTKCL